MTRKADQGRRFVIGGFDIQKRTMLVGGLSMLPGLALTGALFSMLGMWALMFVPATTLFGFWLIEGRSSQGMKLRNWQTMVDRQKNRSGKFFICGHEIDITHAPITFLYTLTVPVEREDITDSEDLFALENI